MKIAVVSTILEFPWGGADTLWTCACETALKRGDKVLLIISPLTAKHPRVREMVLAGASVRPRRRRYSKSFHVRIASKIGRLVGCDESIVGDLRQFAPDLVIINGGGTADTILEPQMMEWLEQSRTAFRVVCNWQQEKPELPDASKESLIKSFEAADLVCFVSNRNMEVTRRLLSNPISKAVVVHNPLRMPPSVHLPLQVSKSDYRFVAVGRLSPEKGVLILIHAIKAALGNFPGWTLEFFGEGPQRRDLERAITDLSLSDRVFLRGYVDGLESIWAKGQILVSSAIDEGVPMTIPEAMIRARPVIATAVGGAEDWITHDKDGFICPAPSVPLMTATLAHAWQRRDDWHILGNAARQSALEKYRPNDFLRLVEQV